MPLTLPRITVAAAVIFNEGGCVLLTRRPDHSHLAGFWEFPGGKQEVGESLESCLKRELKEELGVGAQVEELILSTSHDYPEKVVHLHFFQCNILSGEPKPLESSELAWVPVDRLPSYKLPPADQKLIQKLTRNVL